MKKIKGFKNCNIYLEEQGIVKTSLIVDNNKIKKIGKVDEEDLIELDDKYIVVPGFIDKHIHGANNSDSMYTTQEDLLNISKTIAKEGVTSYLATTMTQTIDNIDKALLNINQYIKSNVNEGAKVIGIHLEGPFINKIFKGAQVEDNIISCDLDTFKHFEDVSGGNIKQVTFAYEENGEELAKYLSNKDIVASIGHSNASAKQVLEAEKNGVTSLTHAFNAMRGLHHREAGTIGGALLADNIYFEIIADLVHVSIEAIEIVYKVKGKDRVILVTDAMEAKHLPDGKYSLGGQEVRVKGREARLNSGALAGSTLHMNEAIKNMIDALDIPITDAVDLATINPARILKIDSYKGTIKEGKDADFTVIDDNLNVYLTVREGNVVYSKFDKDFNEEQK